MNLQQTIDRLIRADSVAIAMVTGDSIQAGLGMRRA